MKDLQAHKGAAVVIPGDNQPPAVHALAHAMNQALGAAGNTVIYTDPVEAKPQDQTAALKELVGDMNAGKVDLLLIVGATRCMTRRRISISPRRWTRSRCACSTACIRTRPAITFTGTSTARIIWKSGETAAPSTEPAASCSR